DVLWCLEFPRRRRVPEAGRHDQGVQQRRREQSDWLRRSGVHVLAPARTTETASVSPWPVSASDGPAYDGAGEPRNVPRMSVTRPDSTGAQPSRAGASAGQASGKASLDAARGELRASIGRGAGGRAALERYADRVDALIRQLFTDAGPDEKSIAIIALGGYGR